MPKRQHINTTPQQPFEPEYPEANPQAIALVESWLAACGFEDVKFPMPLSTACDVARAMGFCNVDADMLLLLETRRFIRPLVRDAGVPPRLDHQHLFDFVCNLEVRRRWDDRTKWHKGKLTAAELQRIATINDGGPELIDVLRHDFEFLIGVVMSEMHKDPEKAAVALQAIYAKLQIDNRLSD